MHIARKKDPVKTIDPTMTAGKALHLLFLVLFTRQFVASFSGFTLHTLFLLFLSGSWPLTFVSVRLLIPPPR